MDLPYSSGASVDLLGEEGIGEYGVRAVRGVATNQGFYRWLSRFSPIGVNFCQPRIRTGDTGAILQLAPIDTARPEVPHP